MSNFRDRVWVGVPLLIIARRDKDAEVIDLRCGRPYFMFEGSYSNASCLVHYQNILPHLEISEMLWNTFSESKC